MAVCDKTFRILTGEPYGTEIVPVPPLKEVPLSRAKPFDCTRSDVRHPAETKGKRYRKTAAGAAVCGPDGGCC